MYFFSVALLILSSGFFYFQQIQTQLIKAEHFSLIKYARHLKMKEKSKDFSKDFHYKMVERPTHIDIRNFTITKNEFMKYIPTKNPKIYFQVFKSKKMYKERLNDIKIKILIIQSLLLLIFAFLSYLLAKNALKPLRESIETLEKFSKDLIHDLNTPVTAMKLNLKLLEKNEEIKQIKAFLRLQKSVEAISELRGSLTTLLEEKTFQVQKLNICKIVNDVIELHQPNYTNLKFEVDCTLLEVNVNENALKQILHNLISNACKYNSKDGFVKIYTKENTLYIEDSGRKIEEPEKIFDREYSTENSTGFGLDIVKRLCEVTNINVDVYSTKEGNCFSLTFS
ncbi:sensor histidine kinase [Sulfurimonas sp.]